MSKPSRRTFVMFGLLGTQCLMAGCGGGGGEANANGSLTAQGSAPSPSPSAAPPPAAPVPSPTPAPEPAPTPAPAAPPPWRLAQTLVLTIGTANTLDLRTTLPEAVRLGGSFEVDATSTPLPAGVQLARDGVLTLAGTAPLGSINGLVFAYNEP